MRDGPSVAQQIHATLKLSHMQQKQHTASMKPATHWCHAKTQCHTRKLHSRLNSSHQNLQNHAYFNNHTLSVFILCLYLTSFHLIPVTYSNSGGYYAAVLLVLNRSVKHVRCRKWNCVSDAHNNTHWSCCKKRASSCIVAQKQAWLLPWHRPKYKIFTLPKQYGCIKYCVKL